MCPCLRYSKKLRLAFPYLTVSTRSHGIPSGPPKSHSPCRANKTLTGAGGTDQDHADLLGGDGAAKLPGLEALYARLEALELGVKALDFVLDYTHFVGFGMEIDDAVDR